jgi:hypothetical protein
MTGSSGWMYPVSHELKSNIMSLQRDISDTSVWNRWRTLRKIYTIEKMIIPSAVFRKLHSDSVIVAVFATACVSLKIYRISRWMFVDSDSM